MAKGAAYEDLLFSIRPLGEADDEKRTQFQQREKIKVDPCELRGSLDGSVSIVLVKIQETLDTGEEDGGGIASSVKASVL